MVTTTRKPQIRLNRELRKAVHRGDGYEDYITIYQWECSKLSLLQERCARMEREIDGFYADGGKICSSTDLLFEVQLQGVTLQIAYDEDGDVTAYDVDGIKGRKDVVQRLLSLFFCLHMIPIYREIIAKTKDELADLDNDSILQGASEIRDMIRGDRYLTVGALSGVDVSAEDDDPFGIFGGERE